MSAKPAVVRRLMREIAELKATPPEGIRIATSEENMLDVTGIIQGPEGTPYAGGYFRVKFTFTEEFPAAPPKCRMVTKIFHPNVSAAGEICVNTLKKDWQSSFGIAHILVVVKCLLIHPNPESALDEEAGKLLLEQYERFAEHATMMTQVHAMPKIPPPEFANAASSSSTPSTSSGSSPSRAKTPASTSAFLAVPPHKDSLSDAENAGKPVSVGDKGDGLKEGTKDRHPSPSPLGIADGNLNGLPTAASVGAAGAGVVVATKAVKRSAGSTGSAQQQRKKALKRL